MAVARLDRPLMYIGHVILHSGSHNIKAPRNNTFLLDTGLRLQQGDCAAGTYGAMYLSVEVSAERQY